MTDHRSAGNRTSSARRQRRMTLQPTSSSASFTRSAPSVQSVISRRRLLLGCLSVPTVAALLAACGDRDVDPGDSATTEPATPETTTPGSTIVDGAVAHSTDPTMAVLRLGYGGGFVAPDYLFSRVPSMVISGDGKVYTPGVMTMEYPGPLIGPITVRTITEAGIQTLLALATADGLLGPAPDYSADTMIADAPTTDLIINAAGSTFTHIAYALGMADPSGNGTTEVTPARRTLLEFTTAMLDLQGTVGEANLGAEERFAPAAFRIRARVVAQSELDAIEPAPNVVDWPSTAGVALADASECVALTAGQIGAVLSAAKQNTCFRDAGGLYFVAAVVVLPGDEPCPA